MSTQRGLSSGKALSAVNVSTNGAGVFIQESQKGLTHSMTDRCLTLAARGGIVPVAGEAALTVTARSPRAAQAAVGEVVAGGAEGGRPAFTPPTALTAGETRVALLEYMKKSAVRQSHRLSL